MPRGRDVECRGEEGEGGDSVGGVEGAEQAFGAGLDQRRERDGEFPDAQPAGAAREVGCQGHVGHGLDGEGVREEGVVAPSSLLSTSASAPRVVCGILPSFYRCAVQYGWWHRALPE